MATITAHARMLMIAVLALSLLPGCSKKADTAAQRQKVAKLLSKEAPKPEHALDIQFGDAFTLIGYDASAASIEPNKPLKITWYYKVTKSPGEGWKQFTHLADGENRSRINLDGNGALRRDWPASSWEAGTYVSDPQTITLPDDWKSDKLVIYAGFWKENERLAVKGPNDGEKRARVLELPVGGVTVAEELPELAAPRASEKLKLDGKLDEPVWAEARSTSELVNTMNGGAAKPAVTVKSAWDDQNLYVAFDVADELLKTKFQNNDDHLWEEDCVEIMVDPDGDGKNYFELQVSPANKSFDTRYETRRHPRPFGHMDWNSGLVSGVSLRGKLNDADKDEGYTAEIAIPWTAFAGGEPKHEAPKPGDSWRVNFYVMDKREHEMKAVGWSPPRVGDFHVPRKFGKLTFGGPTTAAATEAAPKAEEKPAKAAKAPAEKKGATAKVEN
jgi:hypothetical protein